MRPILDESWDVFDRLFSVNVKGLFFLMQAVAQRWSSRAVAARSSTCRRRPGVVARRSFHYCATKAAVISYAVGRAHSRRTGST